MIGSGDSGPKIVNASTPVWVFFGQEKKCELLLQVLRDRRSSGDILKRINTKAANFTSEQQKKARGLLRPKRPSKPAGATFVPQALKSNPDNFANEALQTNEPDTQLPGASVSDVQQQYTSYLFDSLYTAEQTCFYSN